MAMRLAASFSSAKIDATRKGIIKKTQLKNIKNKRGEARKIFLKMSHTMK